MGYTSAGLLLLLITFMTLKCDAFIPFIPVNWPNFLWNNGRSRSLPETILEDADSTTDDLISKYNYPSETHYVTTEDGYILTTHRIAKNGSQPFLLQHGILDSSAAFVLMGPDKSLGYQLWDKGFDVWLGNSRGNRYSKNHTSLKSNQEEFWNFTFHEMGIYDLPATIDYILNTTGFNQLYYIGHSQGATIFFIMCSKKPEYNDKIILMQAMGSIAFLGNMQNFVVSLLDYYLNSISTNVFEFFPHGQLTTTVPCVRKDSGLNILCLEGLFFIQGRDFEQFNTTMGPVLFGHFPAGTSTKTIRHYLQLSKSKGFHEFDYGSDKNRERYADSKAPDYNLEQVSAPIVLHFAQNDLISVPMDIHRTYQELGNVAGLYQVSLSDFNHLDYITAINASNLIYKKMFEIMDDFSKGNLTYVIE